MELIWTEGAKYDLKETLATVEETFGNQVTEKVYFRIRSHIRLLRTFPRIGVYVEDYSTHEDEVRYLVNTPNYIFYSINTFGAIYVLSIQDSRMSPVRISAIIQKRLSQK